MQEGYQHRFSSSQKGVNPHPHPPTPLLTHPLYIMHYMYPSHTVNWKVGGTVYQCIRINDVNRKMHYMYLDLQNRISVRVCSDFMRGTSTYIFFFIQNGANFALYRRICSSAGYSSHPVRNNIYCTLDQNQLKLSNEYYSVTALCPFKHPHKK
jgi:hypothetical protein